VKAAAKNRREVRAFNASMKKYGSVKRDMSHDEVCNHFARQACLWAVKYTPRARKSGFLGEAARPKLKGVSEARKRATGRASFFHALVSRKHGDHAAHPRGQGNYNQALKIFNDRRRAIGAMAAGFLKPAQQLGKVLRTKKAKLIPGASASRSYGTLSKGGQMRAVAHNNVDGSGEVCYEPMLRAMAEVSRREMDYANRQIEKINKQFMVKSIKRLMR
tara:strand:- start:1146 stop:1799 length:654 start_codon:yes stop_codon:yes gene_type:complete